MDPPPEGESGEDGKQPQPEEESSLPSFVSDGLQAVTGMATDMVPKESDLPEFVVEGLAIATSVVAAVSTAGVTSPVEDQQNVKGLQERLRAAGGKLRDGMKPIGKKVQRGMRVTGTKVRVGMKNAGVKVHAGAKLAGGKVRAGLKSTGGKMRAGLKSTGGKVRAGMKSTGGKVRAGMKAVGTKVKGRLQKLPGQMKAGGVQAKEKFQAFRANAKVRGAQVKFKYQEFREDVKVRTAQAKVQYHDFREGVKAKTAQTKVKYRAVRENVKVKAGQARVRFKSFQAVAETRRSSLLTQFMYNCHTMKLQCLVCWGIENPKLVMAGIKRRESSCMALLPTGYGVLLHRALVLTTCEYVSDNKKAMAGEVLLSHGNIRAHSPSLPCVPTQAEIANGIAHRTQRSNSAPAGSRNESKAASKPASRSRSAKSMSRGASRTHSPAHSGASTPSRIPKRTPHTHKLLPSRIFMMNRSLDLTLVACDPLPSVMVPLGLGRGENKRNLDVDRHVYILGHTRTGETHSPLKIGRGRVVECDPMFVKFATETETWVPGGAGFDERGNFAFFMCNPERVPFTQPASMGVNVGSNKKRVRTCKETIQHVGVRVQGIRRWVSQHWDGDSFDSTVPSFGSDAHSREPIPDAYDSQTQPSAKQKWLESYNSAPTYAELALILDVYNRLSTSKRECHNADKERMNWLPKEMPGPSREVVQQKEDRSPSAIARRASAAIRHALTHRHHGHTHEEHYQPRKRKRKK